MSEVRKCAEVLITQSASAKTAGEALQFAEAACKVVIAIAQLQEIDIKQQTWYRKGAIG
jgi:hypothetical protein